MKSRRLFVASWPPDEVVRAAAQVRNELKSELPDGVARYVPDHQIHLTLRFLGEFPDERVADLWSAVAVRVGRPAAFDLRLGSPGTFPPTGRPRVLWLGLEGHLPSLLRLEREVSEASAPFLRDLPRRGVSFHPHLTLARFRDMGRKEAQRISNVVTRFGRLRAPEVVWSVSSLRLMRSELQPSGPSYAVEAEIPFDSTVNPGGVDAG
jgi:2'-5' RNA ligase